MQFPKRAPANFSCSLSPNIKTLFFLSKWLEFFTLFVTTLSSGLPPRAAYVWWYTNLETILIQITYTWALYDWKRSFPSMSFSNIHTHLAVSVPLTMRFSVCIFHGKYVCRMFINLVEKRLNNFVWLSVPLLNIYNNLIRIKSKFVARWKFLHSISSLFCCCLFQLYNYPQCLCGIFCCTFCKLVLLLLRFSMYITLVFFSHVHRWYQTLCQEK